MSIMETRPSTTAMLLGVPTTTRLLVGLSGRTMRRFMGTKIWESLVPLPCLTRSLAAWFWSGVAAGRSVEPSIRTSWTSRAMSSASAKRSGRTFASTQPSPISPSSRVTRTSTKATASSVPAAITVLVRSSTLSATFSISARPTAPAGMPRTTPPGISPMLRP